MYTDEQELLAAIEEEFDLPVEKAPDSFVAAFTHRSYANEARLSYDNERLEFLGDAVLELLTCEWLYGEFPEAREGRMSRIKSSVVNTNALSRLGYQLNLDDFLRLGCGEARAERGVEKELADAFEAFVAAVYLAVGYKQTREFIMPHMEIEIERFLSEGSQNYKGQLLEYVQERENSPPVYVVENVEGPAHSPFHTVSVKIKGDKIARGRGTSKKEAEQQAARRALEELRGEPGSSDAG